MTKKVISLFDEEILTSMTRLLENLKTGDVKRCFVVWFDVGGTTYHSFMAPNKDKLLSLMGAVFHHLTMVSRSLYHDNDNDH